MWCLGRLFILFFLTFPLRLNINFGRDYDLPWLNHVIHPRDSKCQVPAIAALFAVVAPGGIASQELCPVPHALPIRRLLLTNGGGGCQQFSSTMSLDLISFSILWLWYVFTKENVLSPSMVSKV